MLEDMAGMFAAFIGIAVLAMASVAVAAALPAPVVTIGAGVILAATFAAALATIVAAFAKGW